jgi:uncharacterized protein (TIGR03083 family)
MTSERELFCRGEDTNPVVGSRIRGRDQEGRLGQIRPVGELLHLSAVQAVGVDHDCQRVSEERSIREDIELEKSAVHSDESGRESVARWVIENQAGCQRRGAHLTYGVAAPLCGSCATESMIVMSSQVEAVIDMAVSRYVEVVKRPRSTMSIDLGLAYRESRHRVVELIAGVDGRSMVPATPAWSVHDVVAHLVGITEDAVSGNMEGVTTDAWTAAQVDRGRSRSSAALIESWERHAPLVEAVLTSSAGASAALAVIDIHTHEADLCHALGRSMRMSRPVLSWMADELDEGFHQRCVELGLEPVEVRTNDGEWFRGRLGRRTAAEVCA